MAVAFKNKIAKNMSNGAQTLNNISFMFNSNGNSFVSGNINNNTIETNSHDDSLPTVVSTNFGSKYVNDGYVLNGTQYCITKYAYNTGREDDSSDDYRNDIFNFNILRISGLLLTDQSKKLGTMGLIYRYDNYPYTSMNCYNSVLPIEGGGGIS